MIVGCRVFPTRRFSILVVSVVLCLVLFYHIRRRGGHVYSSVFFFLPTSWISSAFPDAAHCYQPPEMDKVMVILKTGITESSHKIPVHIKTSLRCVPHYAIFSDFEEEFEILDRSSSRRVPTVDVLRNVNESVKQTNPDFDLYNRVHEMGRAALQMDEMSRHGDNMETPFGKKDNPGWKLDKWKFLPMIDEALRMQPDAKWFVFMEADSYIIWPNLIRWLSRLDASKPFYLGSQMQIGDVVFAYGGAGIVLSNPAMRKVSEYHAQHGEELDIYTNGHWAGDCILGKVLSDAGVRFSWAWPMMQTARVWETNPFSTAYNRIPWCYPIVSFHHMTSDDIQYTWQFEQQWFEKVRQ